VSLERSFISRAILKNLVAKEAASLLYFGVEKEYKQAKMKAAQSCGIRLMPTNLEVALAFDELVDEKEGATRRDLLLGMRRDALRVMKLLKPFHPVLIGSVWRGTACIGSDIDIAVYADSPEEILAILKNNGLCVSKSEWVKVTKSGKLEVSFHVHTLSPGGYEIEIVVREVAKKAEKRKCDVFGDFLKGLTIPELENLLVDNPLQKFIPC
jgi:predicted nucleotidyltransferase